MHSPLKNSVAFLVGLALLTACAPAGPATPYASGRMIWIDQISSAALAGNLLGDPAERKFTVYLPPGYDAGNKRYPVLYLLQSFRMALVDPQSTSKALDYAIGDRAARDMILVFVDGFNKLGGSFYWDSPTIGDWETFISQELVSHVDSTYRTIAGREGRAISGCSMGGIGALHLAFSHPEVFSVAVDNSGPYDLWSDAGWEAARTQFTQEPADLSLAGAMGVPLAYYMAAAAAAAPNPAKPPLYFDLPFALVAGQAQIVPEVRAKIDAMRPDAELKGYLAQPVRLRGLMIYHGSYDAAEHARAFDNLLSKSGVAHTYLEVQGSHCNLDWTPVIKFASDHLAH